jgi:ACR3 family arsenite efflux pump ArsB
MLAATMATWTEDGALGNANTTRLALLAAGAALAATGLMHLLLLFIPRPWQFFTWILSLTTLAAVLLPFSTGAAIATKVATAAINLAIGVAIGSLVSGVASSAVRRGRQQRPSFG